ncbi:uncharacterized protein ISCGN_002987 [Ixodes scapularis]
MEVSKLRIPELVAVCEELGISVGQAKRRKPIMELLREKEVSDVELQEAWELIRERNERAKAERERDERAKAEKQERDEKAKEEREKRAHELELKSGEEAESSESSKAALLKKYRLSTEAFRQRFRTATKKGTESFPDFAYTLKANLVEWLKSSDVYGDHDKVIECLAVEQFLRGIPETVRFWVQDRDPEMNLRKVADLAEEYSMRRGLDKDKSGQTRSWRDGQKEFRLLKEDSGKGFLRRGNMRDVSDDRESQKEGGAVGKEKKEMPGNNARAFEAKRPVRCFRCQKQGHIVANCPEKVVFSYVAEGADNSALLAPYTKEMLVNGQACTVLRDSAATMDVVHPSYVESGDYTGECAWIRQVVEEHSVCLPIAKICIKGPFGELITEAAVSKNLPQHYPYLFSNKSELLLREQGKTFAEETVMALTRSQARKLSSRLRYEPNEEEGRSAAREELVDGKPAGAANQEDLRSEDAARSSPPDQQQIPEDHEEGQGFISPLSPSLDTLRDLAFAFRIGTRPSEPLLTEHVARRRVDAATPGSGAEPDSSLWLRGQSIQEPAALPGEDSGGRRRRGDFRPSAIILHILLTAATQWHVVSFAESSDPAWLVTATMLSGFVVRRHRFSSVLFPGYFGFIVSDINTPAPYKARTVFLGLQWAFTRGRNADSSNPLVFPRAGAIILRILLAAATQWHVVSFAESSDPAWLVTATMLPGFVV